MTVLVDKLKLGPKTFSIAAVFCGAITSKGNYSEGKVYDVTRKINKSNNYPEVHNEREPSTDIAK